jgi:hypothetical protein
MTTKTDCLKGDTMARRATKRLPLPDYRGFKMFVTTGGTFIAEHPENEEMKTSATTLRTAKQYVLNHTAEGPKDATPGTRVIVRHNYHRGFEAGKLTGEFRRERRFSRGSKVLQAQIQMNKKDARTKKPAIRWCPIGSIFLGTAKEAADLNRFRKQETEIDKKRRKAEKKLKRLDSSEDVHLY